MGQISVWLEAMQESMSRSVIKVKDINKRSRQKKFATFHPNVLRTYKIGYNEAGDNSL